ncbi:MAG: cytochrome d ubiquinol oxidase subunit II [Proteobacteria bacterium]|nr:cytochrome d ubiquinol oxidase subunit II [Pseudomonadota bacterium]
MFLDYEILRLLWWAILGILLIGFAILDGFDLGMAIFLPFLGKSDEERRLMINSIGPIWEGNQVWLILGAGASFAAWPYLYAVSFSGFYLAMFIALFGLVLRPVGFKFRSKMPDVRWRNFWDAIIFMGGFVPSLIFGVAFGNLFLGVPFHFDDTLRLYYTGSFLELLTIFPLMCGVLSIGMMLLQASTYGSLKTRDALQNKFRKSGQWVIIGIIILFTGTGLYLYQEIPGHMLLEPWAKEAPSNPLYKQVATLDKGWFLNYIKFPWSLALPIGAYLSLFLTFFFLKSRRFGPAFFTSSCAVGGIISTAGASLFPFLLISSTHPSQSLTIWDASSSKTTLFIMLIATLIFLPIIIAYTAWVYRVLKGPVTSKTLEDEQLNAY